MKQIQLKSHFSEIISLAKSMNVKYDELLSQKYLAVCHTAKTGFFIAHITGQATPISNHLANIGKMGLSIMGRLIPQNKPIGEYVEWLLDMPRVRPSHPIARVFTQNYLGASIMTAILHHSLTVLADEYHRHSQLHTQNPYAGHGDKANAIYNAMNELVKLLNERNGANVPAKPKTALQRIVERLKGGVQ